MSEALLNAIIQLLALVAREDEVMESEKNEIKEFLLSHLNENEVIKYMDHFDVMVNSSEVPSDPEEEKAFIEKICGQININLTRQQKTVIVVTLIELILADGTITPREYSLVTTIALAFNISQNEVEKVTAFVSGHDPEHLTSQEILVFDDKQHASLNCKHIRQPGVDGYIAFLKMPHTYFMKYEGTANLQLNGVPIRPGNVMVFPTGSALRNAKFNPIYYSDVAGAFIEHQDTTAVTFEVDSVSYKFSNGQYGLKNISFAEESGHLVGLMGASGAGKSTLLNVINGTSKPSEGKVLINNNDIHGNSKAVEGVIGFVPQDDLLMDELTVYQNLYYAAKLCFSHLSLKTIDELVLKTLNSLGLNETKDLKVGTPLEKTISGGQRKRLNIGLELLREPSILFLDEPTSGLSSRDSENIMDLLKELTLKGKLVFVVIHQPSSDIFKMFDRLVIMDVGGYQIYYGNPVEAVGYFREKINLITTGQSECIECGNVNPEQIFNIIETKVVNEYGRFTNERKVTPIQWHDYFKKSIELPSIQRATDEPPKSLQIPNLFKQLRVFLQRDLLSKISNRQYLLINLLEAPLLAFILAFIVRYHAQDSLATVGYEFSKNVNIPAYIFMSIIVALFMGLTVSAEEIIKDAKILKRERFLNLSRSSYLLSKLLILMSLSAFQALTFVLVGNTILEIQGMFFNYWLVMFSCSFFANVLGLNISASFNSAVTIYILIPILLIPQLLLSGVVVRFDKLNPTISNVRIVPLVGDLMASRWAMEASMVTQFKDNEYEKLFYEHDKRIAQADYKRVYYIPKLESILSYCWTNINNKELAPVVENQIMLFKNELNHELDVIGHDKYPELKEFNAATLNYESFEKAGAFLTTLKRFYQNKSSAASEKRVKYLAQLTSTTENEIALSRLRSNFQNESVAQAVKNLADKERIVEEDGRLVQKTNPIYISNEAPKFRLDFRSQFYVPQKYFAGNYFDTFWFNMSVIWIMSLILIVTLYFDLMRRFMNMLSPEGK